MALTCGPLQALPSSHPRCAPQGYTLGRDLKVWRSGHLAPLAISNAARVPEEEHLWVTHVTLVPRGNETLRLEAILPASLPALASFLEADASFTARAFIPAGHYVTSPLTSRPSIGQITLVFRAGHAEGVPLALSDAAYRSLCGTKGYMCNPETFLQTTIWFLCTWFL